MAHLLVIEDNPRDYAALQMMLEFAQHKADIVSDSEQALEMLRGGFRPEGLVANLIMPGLDGFQFSRMLKQDPELATIPLILLTTETDYPDLQNLAKRAGAASLLYKPLQRDEFLSEVDRVILAGHFHRSAFSPQAAVEEVSYLRDYNAWLSRMLHRTSRRLEQAESSLSLYNAHIGAINTLTTALGQDLDLTATTTTLVQKTADLIRAQAVALYYHTENYVFRLQHILGIDIPTPRLTHEYYLREDSPIWHLTDLNEALLFNAPDEVAQLAHALSISDHPISLVVSPLIAQGVLSGFLLAFRTAAPFELSDAERLFSMAGAAGLALRSAQLFNQLEAAYEDLQDLDRRKSEFVAITSHELRTPIAVMLGYASLLAEDEPDPHRRAQIVAIEKQANFLSGMVDALLNLHELKQGQQPVFLRCQPILFNVMLEAALEVTLMYRHNSKNVNIAIDCGPYEIIGDEIRLMLVFSNLMDNAMKFSRQDGLVRVVVAPHPNGGLVVTVEDQGMGVSEEHFERIFEPFYQAEPALTRTYGGMGLGLAIVKAVVELHGGTIELRSKVGQGTRFIITLPSSPPKERCMGF